MSRYDDAEGLTRRAGSARGLTKAAAGAGAVGGVAAGIGLAVPAAHLATSAVNAIGPHAAEAAGIGAGAGLFTAGIIGAGRFWEEERFGAAWASGAAAAVGAVTTGAAIGAAAGSVGSGLAIGGFAGIVGGAIGSLASDTIQFECDVAHRNTLRNIAVPPAVVGSGIAVAEALGHLHVFTVPAAHVLGDIGVGALAAAAVPGAAYGAVALRDWRARRVAARAAGRAAAPSKPAQSLQEF